MSANKPWVGKSVVIVDDSSGVREEMRQVFEAVGMQVVGMGENGVSGLALVEKHHPEMVSLDIIMPEMDGVECFRKIRARFPEQRIMMVSWLAGEAKIIENLKDTMPAHVFQPKPVTAMDLEARLSRIYFPEREPKPTLKAAASDDLAKDLLGDLGVKVS